MGDFTQNLQFLTTGGHYDFEFLIPQHLISIIHDIFIYFCKLLDFYSLHDYQGKLVNLYNICNQGLVTLKRRAYYPKILDMHHYMISDLTKLYPCLNTLAFI